MGVAGPRLVEMFSFDLPLVPLPQGTGLVACEIVTQRMSVGQTMR